MKKKTAPKKKAAAGRVTGLDCAYVPTAHFPEVWRFFTEIAGGKALDQWEPGKSGAVEFGGTTIVATSNEETDEDRELGYPVRHGAATLYFGTPDLDALYHSLANRGAKILRGPLKTHWGDKVMTVKAGDLVVAFVQTSKRKGK